MINSIAANDINYVALGDSISAYFGLEEGQGYAELLADKLVKEGVFNNVTLRNLAQSGDDTQDLLEKIEMNKSTIANADIVTICIGGNNFLGTLIRGMVTPLGISQGTLISQGYFLFSLDVSDEIFSFAARGLQAPEIQGEIARGIARFRADLPNIITKIKELAPNAQIYIMTIYNSLEPDHRIYPILDPILKQINSMIITARNVFVVDIYSAFEEYNSKGLKDQLSLGSIDPHPSAEGHRLIADEHYKIMISNDVAAIIQTREELISDITIEPSIISTNDQDTETTPGQASLTEHDEALRLENDRNISWVVFTILLVLAATGVCGIFIFGRNRIKSERST